MKLAERRECPIPGEKSVSNQDPSLRRLPERPPSRNARQIEPTASLIEKASDLLHSCHTSDERFDLNSLVGQIWLVQLREYTEACYAEQPSANRRVLQTGYAWTSFSKLFEPLSAIELVRLFENLLRFANYEAYPPARAFFLAYAPLAFEHDISGEFIGPGVWTPEAGPKNAATRVRRTLKRWCQWLEALAHFQVHDSLHHASIHRELDKLIILFWPLVKRHNWSFQDLLNVLRSLGNCSEPFPCPSARQLEEYCQSTLRLKTAQRTATKEPAFEGQTVAQRLFKFMPSIS